MAVKAEISWKRKLEDGTRREVNAKHVGKRWVFLHREARFDRWVPLESPPLEDWLELLDAVQRRIQRASLRPEEEARVKTAILELFPGTQFE